MLPTSSTCLAMINARNLEAHNMDEVAEDPMYNFKPIMSRDRFKLLINIEFGYFRFYPTKTDECKTCLHWKTHIAAMAIINPNLEGVMKLYEEHRRNGHT
jgi:hypothetical protein